MAQITDNHKEFHSYITLADLVLPDIPERFTFKNLKLKRKSEYHISLVWGEKIAALIDGENKEKIISEIIEDFVAFNKITPVIDYKLTPEFRFLEKGDQKTIIVMAKVNNLEIFFDELSRKHQKSIPIQPTHITLYTLPPDEIGVGIFDDNQLKEQTKIIDAPLLRDAIFSNE